jgi:hypothetical protein
MEMGGGTREMFQEYPGMMISTGYAATLRFGQGTLASETYSQVTLVRNKQQGVIIVVLSTALT